MTVTDPYLEQQNELLSSVRHDSETLHAEIGTSPKVGRETDSLLHGGNWKETSVLMRQTATNKSKMDERRKMTVQDKITIFVMCVASYCCLANFSIIAPIFPLAASRKDMSETAVGLVIGVYNLIMFVSSPAIGSIISEIGVKFVFVSGALVNAISGVLFGALEYGPPGNVYALLCFLTRGLQALGASGFQVASSSIIAHKFPDRVTTFFSLTMTSGCIGLMTGPPIGGILYQFGGYYLPFCVAGAALGLSGIFIWMTLTPIATSSPSNSRSSLYYLTRPVTITLSFSMFTMSFAATFFEPTLSKFLTKEFGMEVYEVGFMFLIIPATYSLTGPFLGVFCDRKLDGHGYPAVYLNVEVEDFEQRMEQQRSLGLGQYKGYLMTLLIIGPLVAGIAFIFVAPPSFLHLKPSLPLFTGANVVIGIFSNVAYVPLFPALIITALDLGYEDNLHTSGMVSGGLLSAYALGGSVGASVAGGMVEMFGFRLSVFMVAMLYITDTILLIILAVKRSKKARGSQIFDRQHSMEKQWFVKYEEI